MMASTFRSSSTDDAHSSGVFLAFPAGLNFEAMVSRNPTCLRVRDRKMCQDE